MKAVRLTAAVLCTGLIASGVAYASSQFTQTSNVTLTATKAGKPTGIKASIASADPGAVQPQGLKVLKLTLPSKTKFNFKSKAIAQCKASDTELIAAVAAKESPCPAKSKIGAGKAAANGAPVLPVIPENVTAFAGRSQIIFMLTPAASAGEVIPLRGTVKGNVVTTEVPVINKGGLNIVITSLELTVKTIGHGKSAFITAGRCTGGKFKVTSSFTYQTGEQLTIASSSKCKR